MAHLAMVFARSDRRQEADKLTPEILALAIQIKVDPYNVVLLYVARNEFDHTMNWLLRTRESRAISSLGMLRYDPQLDPIRSIQSCRLF